MEEKLYRPCPHCDGKNTGWWTIGVEETQYFTTTIRNGNRIDLLACCEANWRKCPDLQARRDQ
jgi:hypothetical protein